MIMHYRGLINSTPQDTEIFITFPDETSSQMFESMTIGIDQSVVETILARHGGDLDALLHNKMPEETISLAYSEIIEHVTTVHGAFAATLIINNPFALKMQSMLPQRDYIVSVDSRTSESWNPTAPESSVRNLDIFVRDAGLIIGKNPDTNESVLLTGPLETGEPLSVDNHIAQTHPNLFETIELPFLNNVEFGNTVLASKPDGSGAYLFIGSDLEDRLKQLTDNSGTSQFNIFATVLAQYNIEMMTLRSFQEDRFTQRVGHIDFGISFQKDANTGRTFAVVPRTSSTLNATDQIIQQVNGEYDEYAQQLQALGYEVERVTYAQPYLVDGSQSSELREMVALNHDSEMMQVITKEFGIFSISPVNCVPVIHADGRSTVVVPVYQNAFETDGQITMNQTLDAFMRPWREAYTQAEIEYANDLRNLNFVRTSLTSQLAIAIDQYKTNVIAVLQNSPQWQEITAVYAKHGVQAIPEVLFAETAILSFSGPHCVSLT